MSEREILAAGEAHLTRFLEDPLAIPRAIKAKDFVSLAGAAEIADHEIAPSMALLNPPRYRALRAAVTSFHLKGYGLLDEPRLKRRALAELKRLQSANGLGGGGVAG